MIRIIMMVLRNLFRVPWLWFKLCRYAKYTDRYSEGEKYAHIRKILKIAVESGNIDLTVTGLENLPKEGGYILYGNHQGMFDVLAVGASHERPLGVVFKKELENIPFIKQVIACTKSFAMDRSDVRQSMTVIQAVTEEVKKGRRYVIFPEGTRSKKGNQMGEFHAGSFRCAVKAQCPVVPMAFVDSFRVLDEKGCRKVAVQLHYLAPIPWEEYSGMKTVELAELVKRRIGEKIAECTGEIR